MLCNKLAHYRSYITFDILRRVLSNYFGYEVFYVMNITDIDDKIIKRARQHYLYDKYVDEKRSLEQVIKDANEVNNKNRSFYFSINQLQHNFLGYIKAKI